MSKQVFDQVKTIEGYPCVTLVAPTHRAKPDSLQDPIRIGNLIREAEERLGQEMDSAEYEPILKHLRQAADEIDHNYNQEGLAIFANRDLHAIARLPYDVQERVVIDHNFATRDLIRSFFLNQFYYVMTLSWDKIRLFAGRTEHLEEVKDQGFPFAHNFGVTDRIDWSIAGYEDAQIREFFNQVDKVFFEVYKKEAGKLVLAGVKDNIAHYKAIADRPESVYAEVHGNFDEASAHQIAEQAWPVLRDKLEQEKIKALDELDKAFGAKRASAGIQEVYRLAQQGRGHKLLVEKGYFQPASIKKDHGVGEIIDLDTEADEPGAIDDLIDEVAEQVVAHQGEVIFLDDGSLQDHDRIAMILRY